jgi:two-component system NtrC family sensor kinase
MEPTGSGQFYSRDPGGSIVDRDADLADGLSARQATHAEQKCRLRNLDELIPVSWDELPAGARSSDGCGIAACQRQLDEWNKTLENRISEKTEELQSAQKQIVIAERMASIGKLAAIVAHEINNPLSGILTYAKLLLKQMRNEKGALPKAETATQYLEVIASESARCGEIVKNLLQFARQTTVNLQPNPLNELIRQSLRLVQHKIDLMNLQTLLRLDEALPQVFCDAQLIRQALVALFLNACEAMPAGEGILEIQTQQWVEKSDVEVTIRDNGVGMDEETQKHIFEPFFTTKEQGKGVGLGLAVVYGIVQQHSGTIEVQSSPGKGTAFLIRLPLKTKDEQDAEHKKNTELLPHGVEA